MDIREAFDTAQRRRAFIIKPYFDRIGNPAWLKGRQSVPLSEEDLQNKAKAQEIIDQLPDMIADAVARGDNEICVFNQCSSRHGDDPEHLTGVARFIFEELVVQGLGARCGTKRGSLIHDDILELTLHDLQPKPYSYNF
jgi:hypothetical protein